MLKKHVELHKGSHIILYLLRKNLLGEEFHLTSLHFGDVLNVQIIKKKSFDSYLKQNKTKQKNSNPTTLQVLICDDKTFSF